MGCVGISMVKLCCSNKLTKSQWLTITKVYFLFTLCPLQVICDLTLYFLNWGFRLKEMPLHGILLVLWEGEKKKWRESSVAPGKLYI